MTLRPQPTRRTSWKLVANPGWQPGFPTSSPSGLRPLWRRDCPVVRSRSWRRQPEIKARLLTVEIPTKFYSFAASMTIKLI